MTELDAARVVFLTFPKCGSQWLRDVLTSPRILEHSGGFTAANPGVEVSTLNLRGWPECPPRTISGPVYNAAFDAWRTWARPGDKAVVVLRDPRDVVVSYLYSLAYSHEVADARAELARSALLGLDKRGQMLFSIGYFASFHKLQFGSWAGRENTATELILRYESLVRDSESEFRRIFAFLGWPVPAEVSRSVIEENSFRARSGRERGEEDIHSHFRKATPGDWASHFDRATGRAFELLLPRFPVRFEYTSDERWYETLPPRRG